MTRDDLNSIIRLAGIKRNISETEGWSQPPQENPGVLTSTNGTTVKSGSGIPVNAGSSTNSSTNPPTKDQNIPTTFIPTHYHETMTGRKEPLMMTKPGEFWIQTRDGITRFVPQGEDVETVTKPGFSQRLSVDGEIEPNGTYLKYKRGKTWVDGLNDEEGTWKQSRVAGAFPAAQTAPAQTAPAQTAPAQTAPAQTAPAAVGSDQPASPPARVSTQSVSSSPISIQTINSAGQQSGTAPKAGPSGVDPDVQAQVNRLRAEYNNSSGSVAPEPAPTLPPGVNPENGIQQYTPVDYSKDKLKEPPGTPKKKVLAPVDKDLQAIQQKLSADSKYGRLLGPFGADGRIGRYTRNSLETYLKDHPDDAENPKLKPILDKYRISAAGQQGPTGPRVAAGPSGEPPAAASGPSGEPPAAASGPSGAPPAPNQRPTMPNDPRRTDASAASGPSGAPLATPSGPGGAPPRRQLSDIRSSVERAGEGPTTESVLTPIEQIQKIRKLVDLVEEPQLGDLSSLPPGAAEPKLGQATSQTKARPVPTLLGGSGKTPDLVRAEADQARRAGQLGLKAIGGKVLGFIASQFVPGVGWAADAYALYSTLQWFLEYVDGAIQANAEQVNIDPDVLKQLNQDLKDLKPYLTDKNVSPQERSEAKDVAEKITRILARSEVASAWGKVGVPGKSGAPKK